MSSRLKQTYLELMQKVQNIVTGSKTTFKYYNIWDEQIPEMISGNGYAFNSPACFFEIELGRPVTLGMQVTSYPECIVRVRIGQVLLDGRQKTMERNTEIFDLKDKVVAEFLKQSTTYMSTFQLVEDIQDFSHDNYYQYVLAFSTHYIEVKGTIYDNPDTGYIDNFVVNLVQTYIDQNGVRYGDAFVHYINTNNQ